MEKFKLLLAWLDWSTYAKSSEDSWKSNYSFPKSLCNLAWRTLFSVVMLPITWIAHIWNRLFVSMNTFRNENSEYHKLNVWSTLGLTFISIMVGFAVHDYTDGRNGTGGWGWDLFHMSDPIILTYLKILGCGIVGIAIIAIMLLIFIAIAGFIGIGIESLVSNNNSSKSKYAAVNAIKAIKNKYCPTIDWSSIKKK